MINPKLGNRIILLALAIAIAVGSLFTLWTVVTLTAEDLQQSAFTFGGEKVTGATASSFMQGFLGIKPGTQIPLDGLQGHVALGPLDVPYWGVAAGVVLGLLLTMANSCRFADIPRKLVLGLLTLCILLTLWDMVGAPRHCTPRIGEFLIIATAVVGLTQQRPIVPRLAPPTGLSPDPQPTTPA